MASNELLKDLQLYFIANSFFLNYISMIFGVNNALKILGSSTVI